MFNNAVKQKLKIKACFCKKIHEATTEKGNRLNPKGWFVFFLSKTLIIYLCNYCAIVHFVDIRVTRLSKLSTGILLVFTKSKYKIFHFTQLK